MIDHDARPALIYVPNSAELRGPSRASALTSAAGLSAEDRGASTNATQLNQHDQIEVMYAQ